MKKQIEIKLKKGYTTFPYDYKLLKGKYKKLRPFFAFGNRPNITHYFYQVGITKDNVLIIQDISTFQVYLVENNKDTYKVIEK